jgi:hypothetical protein
VASAHFGDASSESAASLPAVFPNVKYHGRIDKSMGCFTRPSQAGRTPGRPSATPRHVATAFMRPAKRHRERIEASDVGSFPHLLRRSTTVALNKVSRISHILFLRITLVMCLPWSSRFALYGLEGLKDGRRWPALNLALGLVSVARYYCSNDNY